MQIRLARPEDITTLSEYWYDQMAIWQQSSASLRLVRDAQQQWEQSAHAALQMPDTVFLVAQVGEEVVGAVLGSVIPNQPGLAPAQIGLVQALIVDNHTVQGHGAGRLLLDAWSEDMRERGITQIQVQIPAQAVVQQAFWRGEGALNVMDVFWMTI